MLVPVRQPFSGGFSTMGNTAGNTGFATGRMALVGSQNITLSGSTDASGNMTVSFSGGAGAAGNTGFISANATASLGTVVFSNSNGLTFGINGQTLTMSHNGITSQSTQFLALTLGGNTAGTTTFHATNNASLFLNGGNNITLSGNGSTVTISAANQTVQTQGITNDQVSLGVSTGGNTSGNTTVQTGNRFVLAGGNNITLSQGTGAGSTTVTISAANQTNQSAIKALGVSNTGQTAGNTGVSTGIDWVLAGSQSITLSQSTAGGGPNTIWIQHPAWITTADLSQNSSKYVQNWKLTGNTAGTTSSAQGTDLWLSGGANITVSGSSNTIVISGGAGAAAFSGGMSTAGNTSGDTGYATGRLNLVGSNNITLSGSTNGGSMSITISGPNVQSAGMSTAGNTSSNSGFVTGQFALAGGNNVTLSGSTNGASMTITVSGPNMMSAGFSTNGNTAGNTGFGSAMAMLVGGNNITLSGSTNAGSITVSIIGAAGGGGNFSGGASNLGNTAGNTGITGTRLIFVGTNMVSLSQTTDANGATLSINATQTNQSAIKGLGVSNTGNTAGNTGLSTGIDWVIAGVSNGAITASQSTAGGGPNTIWMSVPQTSSLSATGWASISTNGSTISIGASTTMNVYGVGNTSGTSSGTVDIRTLSISVGSGVQIAASNSGWNIGLQQVSQLDPYPPLNLNTASTLGQNSVYMVPFDVFWPISASRINFFVSVATGISAANSTGRAGYTLSAALYSRMTGASTDRISSFWSMTAGMSATVNSNTQFVATNLAGINNSTAISTVGTTISSSNATTYMANSMGGFRVIPLPISTNLTPGRYWLAVANSTTSSNAGVVTLNCSVMQQSFSNQIAFRPFGTSSAASDASFYNMLGLGTYSGTSNAFPGSMALTSDSIRGAVTGIIPYFNLSGYTNSTNWL